jgi:hypothetical protein
MLSLDRHHSRPGRRDHIRGRNPCLVGLGETPASRYARTPAGQDRGFGPAVTTRGPSKAMLDEYRESAAGGLMNRQPGWGAEAHGGPATGPPLKMTFEIRLARGYPTIPASGHVDRT